MKPTAFLLISLAAILALTPAKAQHQSKENFEHRNTNRSCFRKLFGSSKTVRPKNGEALAARKLARTSSGNKLSAGPTQWNKNQRKQADQIWQQQRNLRSKQQVKNRKPTAWELAYLKQEKQRLKELKKLLEERDERIAARAKNRHKAMASAAKYRKQKARHAPAKNNSFGTVFSSANDAPGAGNAFRKK